MRYTIDEAQQWSAENREQLDRDRLSKDDEDVRFMNRAAPDKSRELWDSGVWVAERLCEMGANDGQLRDAQTIVGQRALAGSAWEAAVRYANEFAASGAINDKPGNELADEINREMLGEQPPES